MKVKVTKTAILTMTKEDFEMLKEACFEDGDRQMLNEMVDLDCDGKLLLEDVTPCRHDWKYIEMHQGLPDVKECKKCGVRP